MTPIDLPALPAFLWSKAEARAIVAYAKAAVLADRAKMATVEPAPIAAQPIAQPVAELERDATRYRFLRAQPIDGAELQPVIAVPNEYQSGYYVNDHHADLAVDTAMQKAAIAQPAPTPGSWAEFFQDAADIAQPVQPAPPTLEQLEFMLQSMVTRKEIIWSGFRKDADGRYTIPVISKSDYKFALAAIEHFSQPVQPKTWLSMQPLPTHDNHHNALRCPYCNPRRLVFAEPVAAQTVQPADDLEALRADAARYRWLREPSHLYGPHVYGPDDDCALRGVQADDAIDYAISSTKVTP